MKAIELIGDIIHLLWWFTWRTVLFLGGVIGFFYLISLIGGPV